MSQGLRAQCTLIITAALLFFLPFSAAADNPLPGVLVAELGPGSVEEGSVPEAGDAALDASLTTVTSLGVVADPGGTIVTISGDGPLIHEYFLIEGKSLVIDIYDAVNTAWPTIRKVEGKHLDQIKIGEHFKPRRMVRVLLEMRRSEDYQVRGEGNRIIVAVGRPGSRPDLTRPPPPMYNLMTAMIFQPMPDRSRVQFTTNSDPEYRVVDSGDPRRIVLEIDGTELSPAVQSALDLSRLERELTRVDVSGENVDGKPMVRITAQLSRGVPFRVTPGEGGIYLDVDRGADRVTPLAATEGPRKRATAQIRYGTKLSLDFVDADVGDILRLISDVSGINFVSGDEVNGKVSVRLIDVPWETALETILMTNNPLLAQVPVADNIIRITTEDKLLHEEEKRQKKKELERRTLEASKELEPLVMREIPISYAQIGEKGKLADGKGSLMDIAYGFTSPRIEQDGLFKADPRTNTLIVKDLQSNVDEIERVIRKLDTPTPAVIVEARIVEVGDGVAESLGIRWNARFNADPAHGNALPVAFPNSLAVEGAQTDPNEPGNFMVNLPASNPTAAVGISFGHIASTLSLDMQLTAMENMGKTKILSTPKILVVQNEKASINIGDRLPVPQTDAEGNRTVEFLRTGILLEVTPQVTNDGRVFMDILIEKSSPGATVITTDGPMFSIETRDATTKVLIGDGETAVIGGILEQFSDDTRNSVPHLSKIPGLGWLFRSKSTTETRTELMIFLTPRIIPSG